MRDWATVIVMVLFCGAMAFWMAGPQPAFSADIQGGAATYMDDRRQAGESVFGLFPEEGHRTFICATKHGEQPLKAETDDPWYGKVLTNLTDVTGWIESASNVITGFWTIFTVTSEQAFNTNRAEDMTCMVSDNVNRALIADVADADGLTIGSGGQDEAHVKVDGPIRFMALPEGQEVPLKKR